MQGRDLKKTYLHEKGTQTGITGVNNVTRKQMQIRRERCDMGF